MSRKEVFLLVEQVCHFKEDGVQKDYLALCGYKAGGPLPIFVYETEALAADARMSIPELRWAKVVAAYVVHCDKCGGDGWVVHHGIEESWRETCGCGSNLSWRETE